MSRIVVGTSAVQLPAKGSGRPVVQNLGPGDLYWDVSNAVTVAGATGGVKISVGATYEFPADLSEGAGSVWLIASVADTDVRYAPVG